MQNNYEEILIKKELKRMFDKEKTIKNNSPFNSSQGLEPHHHLAFYHEDKALVYYAEE